MVRGAWDVWHLMQPTFVHASPGHLFGNLLYLFAFGAVVEYGYGSWRMLVIYLLSGLGGSIASWLWLGHPGLSVGASGAIFGTIGATFVYLVRHHRTFHERLRWRARRVFIPMVLAVAAYSLLGGNLWAHAFGMFTGALAGLVLIRPLPEREMDIGEVVPVTVIDSPADPGVNSDPEPDR